MVGCGRWVEFGVEDEVVTVGQLEEGLVVEEGGVKEVGEGSPNEVVARVEEEGDSGFVGVFEKEGEVFH